MIDGRRNQKELYFELSCYTLAHPGPQFIHQHAVDAYAAQTAGESTKPITLVFALVGLYLMVEKGFSGRDVQRAHMRLAQKRKQWPRLELPENRGRINVADVIAEPPGEARDRALRRWCASVWEAFSLDRQAVIELVENESIVASRG